MMHRIAMRSLSTALMALAGWLVAPQPSAFAQEEPRPKAASDSRTGDSAAIRSAMQSFVEAFRSGDAKALAGHWTAEGEYLGEDGGEVRGREALEKSFAAFFAKHPKVHAEAQPESLRFVSRDVAIQEGTVTVRRDPSDPPVAARYEALLVREDGRWRFARLSESASEEDTLQALAWLVGDWKSTGQDVEVTTRYSWNDTKTFLKVHFSIKEKDRTLGGDQFLGRDPASGEIRAWTFEATGGIGEGTWRRDGDRWVVETQGTLPNGDVLTATNILTKVNDDTFTWQSIDRTLGDEELPDLAPVKVTRIKPKS
jgi:uncharacterized protein (TIGR02246 family)